MISIGKTTSVDQAVRYLLEAQADALIDYMAGRGEAPGRWTGRGAAALGLHGEVTADALRAVLSGIHPTTGEQLGQRWASQKVVAFDVTFSCPKSVSLLYALGDAATREAVLRAQATAVDAVVAYLQEHAGWGRRYDPLTKSIDHVRADLVMACFVHRTARPVTDPDTKVTTIDPQLHTHVVIPTWVLRDDGTWGHLYSEPLYQHAAPGGAIGQAVLRDELVRELGIAVEVLPNSCFEVVGISQEQRDEFSRRTFQVQAMEEAQGADSFHGHKLAVTSSRQTKDEVAPGSDVFAGWRARAERVGLTDAVVDSLLQREPHARRERSLDVPDVRSIVGSRGLTAGDATFTRRDVVRAVATHAPLGMSRKQIESTVNAILARRDEVVTLTDWPTEGEGQRRAVAPEPGMELHYSTPEMVQLERAMLETARARGGADVGVADATAVTGALRARPMLTQGQRHMVEAVCLRGDGVTLVEGAAGVGKSLALDACREALEQSGYTVVGCSLAGRAAAELQDASGIRSFTVTSTLLHLRHHRIAADTVLVVDEAGMVGSRDLAELIDIAARDEVKLVAVGDPKQLQPIEAGAPFRALARHLGAVQLTENVRQQELWERQVLHRLRIGDADGALEGYRANDRIRTARNAWDRRVQIVGDYMAVTADGTDTIMLARRRDDVAELNALARAASVADGRVRGPALIVNQQPLQAGDQVICLQNSRRPITNGLRGEVTSVDLDTGMLTMRSTAGHVVRIDTTTYDALDYGYALTGHKAQSATADVGLVLGSAAATREWAYSVLARGRIANWYYVVGDEPIRDTEGVMHWPEEEERTVDDRIARAWFRSEAKDSTLDYAQRLARDIGERDRAGEAVDTGRIGPASEHQRTLLRTLDGPELDPDTSWVRASIEIDRRLGRPLGAQATQWLEAAGLDPDTARDVVRDALVEAGVQTDPAWLSVPGLVDAMAADQALVHDRDPARADVLGVAEVADADELDANLSPWDLAL